MSEAIPDRRSTRFIPGALVFLRAVIVIAITSLSASANPAMAHVSSMPEGCIDVMAHADGAFAGASDAAAEQESSHQVICSLSGCLTGEPAGHLSDAVTLGLRDAVSFVVKDKLGAGRVISPNRRPPIDL